MAVNIETLSRATTSNFQCKVKELYPYQAAGVEFICRVRKVLLADSMGVGKTAQAIAAFFELGINYVVVCPASLQENWRREIKRWTGVEAQKYVPKMKFIDPHRPLIITYGQATINGSLERICEELSFTGIAVDECFVAGTMIDTPTGPKPIETIKVGDKINNCVGVDTVVATHRNQSSQFVTINGLWTCTPNHPFFTTRGWVCASELRKGDALVKTSESLRLVLQRVHRKTHIQTYAFLRKILLREVENATTGRSGPRPHRRSLGQVCGKKQRSKIPDVFRMASEKQLYAQARSAEKAVRYFESNGAQATYSGWERDRAFRSRSQNIIATIFRVGVEFLRRITCSEKRTAPVQVGYSKPAIKNSYRVRRGFPLRVGAAGTGPVERLTIDGVRVESITVEKRGCTPTYNLAVRKHPSYSANGILVHNCHAAKSPEAQRTRRILNRHLLLAKATDAQVFISGTPIENRPIELYMVLHAIGVAKESRHEFGSRYSKPQVNFFTKKLEYVGAQNTAELSHRLRSTCMIRRTKAEVLPFLPPKIRREIILNVDPRRLLEAELKFYDTPNLTLSQLDEVRQIRAQLAIIKAPKVVEYIEDALESSEKVVVFGWHRELLTTLLCELSKFKPVIITGGTAIADRQKRVDRFQTDPTCRVFLGAITAAGTGITLTASSHVIMAEMSWKPGENEQASDRCHRISQKNSVLVDFLCFPRSADERVLKACKEKQSDIDSIMS